MILRMARLRILGPRALLPRTLAVLQDLELLHLAPPCEVSGCARVELEQEQADEQAALAGAVEDLEQVVERLGTYHPAGGVDLERLPERARALRLELEALEERQRSLQEERALLERYRELVQGFEPLLASSTEALRSFYLVLPAAERRALRTLKAALRERAGDRARVFSRPLSTGDLAVAVVVSAAAAARVERLLAEASLEELAAPQEYGAGALTKALPGMLSRLAELPGALDAIAAQEARLRRERGPEAAGLLAAAHDRLATLEALAGSAETASAFVVEGWAPEREVRGLIEALRVRVGPELEVERVAVEDWSAEATPVRLRNPWIFRPFEALTSLLPLPAYGTLDPTPFVAIGFPMMFGIILGDIAYGALLALLSAVLALRSDKGSTRRSIGAIGVSCAAFTIIFGFLYGELLGDLGHRWLGLEPLLLNREEAIVPALVLALGIGVVHVVLGLVLGVINSARSEPRRALGRGLAAVMVLLVVLALLVVVGVLPKGLMTPVVVAALVAFPLLVVAEGFLGGVELLSTLANVLSYARIMAVGTASVMMAVVANRVAGAAGSALVGVLFALLFHLVNFTIGVFGPAIHVLRLHYVEFFGKFFSPGGTAYTPLAHWHPPTARPQEG